MSIVEAVTSELQDFLAPILGSKEYGNLRTGDSFPSKIGDAYAWRVIYEDEYNSSFCISIAYHPSLGLGRDMISSQNRMYKPFSSYREAVDDFKKRVDRIPERVVR
ncbi:MAG: hypothetical protein ACP5D2_03415 [Candidatus Nanoarchaeia archaeon]